jgi:hypothetical protein
MSASNKYRKGQDNIAAFVSERIIKTGDSKDTIGKRGLMEDFKLWFSQEQSGRKIPKGQELYDYLDKKFGQSKQTGWSGIKFIHPDASDEIEELNK